MRAGGLGNRREILRFAQDDDALRLGARKAGAGARGHASGVALRAIVGLVAGDVHFEQGARGDVEFQASAAAVNDSAGCDSQAAFLFHDSDGFARGAAGGPHVFNDQNAFARLQLEAAAQRHLAGAIAFYEKRTNAKRASDFVADDQAAERGRDDAGDGVILEALGEGAAELFCVLRMLQDKRALDVRGAVASAGKLKMSRADGTYLFEQLQNFVALHRTPSGACACRSTGSQWP